MALSHGSRIPSSASTWRTRLARASRSSGATSWRCRHGRRHVSSPRGLGLIPARSGSKRILGKNARPLCGHPLMSYSIASALESGVFEKVIVSTDLGSYGTVAHHYGADVIYRPPEMSSDTSPDIEFVEHALKVLPGYDAFAILRPTSPFRQAATIRRGRGQVLVGKTPSPPAGGKGPEHPGKM